MANQYKNKVIYGNQTLMDITDTTATENDVLEGEVFYTASGARGVGTLGDATTTTHGLMSTSDKIKLDGIDLLGVKLNTTTLTPDANGYVSIPLMTGATSNTNGAAGLVPAPTTTDINYFLRGDGTWASADTWGGTTYSPYSYTSGSEYYIPARTSMNGTSMSSIWVSSTPNTHALAKYDANKYLYSTTPGTSDNSTKVATTAFVNSVLPTTMTGATSSAAGTAGLIPAPTSADSEKFFRGDGTWQDGGRPMVILSYGNSTWNDFIEAYNNHVIVYCRASSNSNPKTGSQTRMAFMAYVNNAETPTEVEFQYYRSVNAHSATQMGDQVYVYKLTNKNAWTVTVREASVKKVNVSGSGLSASWSNNQVTLSNTMTADDMPMSSNDTITTKSAIDTINTTINNMFTSRNYVNPTTDDDIRLNTFLPGIYMVANSPRNEYLPISYGTMVKFSTNQAYSGFLAIGTDGSVYVRHCNATEWHIPWTKIH